MTLKIEDGNVTAKDVFRVQEAYSWRDDIMEITRQIVHEADEARLSNIVEHFEVDLSEIREYINMKQRRNKPQTNADRIRSMTDEELAEFLVNRDLDVVEKASKAAGFTYKVSREECLKNVLDWLKQEASE